jgi:hypothetical protein
MEGLPGQLFGFFYMFLLFIQLSLAGTKYHNNKLWIFILEIIVLFHGTTVAILQGGDMWPMFLFGFGFIFIVTQLYGLKLSKKVIIIITSIYVISAGLVFSGIIFGIREISEIHQITWIPFIEYLLVFVFAILLEIPTWVSRRVSRKNLDGHSRKK